MSDVRGPFNYHDPVHETLTQETLKAAGLLPKDKTYQDPDAWEYTRGVFWNDDPQAMLFDDGRPWAPDNDDYSSGTTYGAKFKSAESQAASGTQYGQGAPLLSRSHFGDLQGLHGMATQDKEDPAVTKQKMMMWAEFTTRVAEGKIAGDAKLGAIAMDNPQFKALIGSDPTLKDQTVSQLFGIEDKGDVKKRATGSLLHLIQDSYAEGHEEREDLGDGRRGKIKSFHSYAHQDHDKHGAADHFPEGPLTNEYKAHHMAGGQDAIDQGAAVLKMITWGQPPEKILEYLNNTTFKTADDIGPATAGEKFKAPPPPAPPTAAEEQQRRELIERRMDKF